jgi:hypothetical protein
VLWSVARSCHRVRETLLAALHARVRKPGLSSAATFAPASTLCRPHLEASRRLKL